MLKTYHFLIFLLFTIIYDLEIIYIYYGRNII